MREQIEAIKAQIATLRASTLDQVEAIRVSLIGSRNGSITNLFDQFKALSGEEKRALGGELNGLKNSAINLISTLKAQVEDSMQGSSTLNGGGESAIDITLPASNGEVGSRHPISIVRASIIDIFHRIGFATATGPEIEDDYHVFGALNFADDHPARDMQDTFFIENDILLRTHTSSVQVRVMERQKPPIRVICPGRVFRNEAISYRAHCIFHQIEGLYIDRDVSFADLKQTIEYFAKEFFGSDAQIRLRPSYFPFTEPSAEVDVSCVLCGGKGCPVCKGTGWLEIMGAGMVHPNVLEASGIDSTVYSGFAFGMGVERTTMLKYGVRDLRLYFENDVRFLNQFRPII